MSILNLIKEQFEKYNFKVSINKPFEGGFITSYYGDPKKNLHVVQIELNKELYFDESKMKISQKKSFKIVECLKEIITSLKNNF